MDVQDIKYSTMYDLVQRLVLIIFLIKKKSFNNCNYNKNECTRHLHIEKIYECDIM